MISAFRLPWMLQRRLEAASSNWLHSPEFAIDFARPMGEEGLVSAHSISWRIFKNPVALFMGGIAAVLLELADPVVRTGVWQHSSFNKNPLGRLRRTGLAAMVTVYGPRSVAEPMIARVVRMHSRISGVMPNGVPYSANDGNLLTWVHATAAYGFASAYSRYVEPLTSSEFDAYYQESLVAAGLYGATDPPRSAGEVHALFQSMRSRLEPSPIILRFLQIMCETPALPKALRWTQASLVRAAIELVPPWMRERIGLDERHELSSKDKLLATLAGAAADRIVLEQSPAVRSCLRLGLKASYLYR